MHARFRRLSPDGAEGLGLTLTSRRKIGAFPDATREHRNDPSHPGTSDCRPTQRGLSFGLGIGISKALVQVRHPP